MTDSHERFAEDCAAYVLGALHEDEAGALRAHLLECASCREEVARLRSVADALGRAVPPLLAPPDLRRRVLGAVASEAAITTAATPATVRPRRNLARLRPAFALVGGLALAIGLLVGALVLGNGGPSTRTIAASVAPAAAWHASHAPVATLRDTGGAGVLVVAGLPPAPAGRIYEVWVERGSTARQTDALFDASAGGRATVAVPGNLHGAQAVLVTAERRGGARVPTMAPLIDAPLG
jgi:hypothetical protein